MEQRSWNLISEPRKIRVDPAGKGVRVELDRLSRPPELPRQYIKHIKIQSRLLSDLGRPCTWRPCFLPEGSKTIRGPLSLIINHGHFPRFRDSGNSPDPAWSRIQRTVPINGYNRIQQEEPCLTSTGSGGYPRFLIVEIQHATPIMTILMRQFANLGLMAMPSPTSFCHNRREIPRPRPSWARFMYGGSTAAGSPGARFSIRRIQRLLAACPTRSISAPYAGEYYITPMPTA